MKILLIQTAYIGDVILTTPLIHAIARHFPDAHLTVMVKPEARSLLANNPDVDEVLVIEKRGAHRGLAGMMRFIKEVKSRQFDVLLSPHKSYRTSFIALLSGIPRRIGFADASLARLAYHRTVPHRKAEPEIRRLLHFLQDAMGIPVMDEGNEEDLTQLRLYESESEQGSIAGLVEDLHLENAILFAVSSVWATKQWTPEGFANLMNLMRSYTNHPFALVGSPGDFALSETVLQHYQQTQNGLDDRRVYNLCGKTSLPGLYSLMKRSSLLVSNDSAPVHVAAAARIPIVAIFGPTIPAFGYAPITPESTVVELEGLECRPCGSHGGRKCPRGHFRCMRELTAEQVFEGIGRVTAINKQ